MLYGFLDKRLVIHNRFFTYAVAILFVSVTILLYQEHLLFGLPDGIFTILAALIGAVIAIDVVFLQIKLSQRHQMEAKALLDINIALRNLSEALAGGAVLGLGVYWDPLDPGQDQWRKLLAQKHDAISQEELAIRKASTGLFVAIEANEMAIIHLEHYYRYVTIKVNELIKALEIAINKFAQAGMTTKFGKEEYIIACKCFDGHLETIAQISAYTLDLQKILQNELLGNIFERKLLMRVPKEGYGTTLDRIATKEHVAQLLAKIEQSGVQPAYEG